MACEVTLQPLRRFGMDAAIIFSDILIPIAAMGMDLTFAKNHGPQLNPPIRGREDLARLSTFNPEKETGVVGEIVGRVRDAVGDQQAVIGFAGAPFTLLCYMVEGQGSRNFAEAKKLLFTQPDVAHELLDMLSDVLCEYLAMQIRAGADAVQLFDTWTSLLSPEDFDTFAAPYARKIMEFLAPYDVPRIYFPRGIGSYLERSLTVPCEVLGIDWMQDLGKAIACVGQERCVQGNIDPTILLGSMDAMERRMEEMLAQTEGYPGHIVNLGHGILPPTRPEMVGRFVELAQSAKV